MNERDIELANRLARDAHLRKCGLDDLENLAHLAYAAGVAAEREACAKLCEDKWDMYGSAIPDCIVAIRARGNT